MKNLPRIVIVGRMNVGKSTLFNRLSVSVKSLTLDYDGVTRDFIKDTVDWQGHSFDLIDTGGISLRKTNDVILETVRKKALDVVKSADVVLFVCDAKIGILPEDREISKYLHTLSAKVILIANKVDSSLSAENIHEFDRLGHKSIISISAQHGTGIADLLEASVNSLPAKKEHKDDDENLLCKVVLLGKPNVGKSSLMNLLVKDERSIVADIPGTTREAVAEKISFCKEDILLTDTAGVRRKRAVNEQLEGLMVKSSFKALKDAHLVLLLVDASQGRLADQELKLAFYSFEHYKSLIILFNKRDLVTQESEAALKFNLEPYQHLIKKIETINISCKNGKNVGRVMRKVQKVCKRHSQRFSDDELSILFKEALIRRQLFHKTNPLRVLRVRQIGSSPIAILIIANEPKWFGSSQLAYFENQMRRVYDLKGAPIKFVVRKKG
ncbi:ribosome biogenesis GTPase Der [bacterium]|nr:ribosome biogenesis GTPase Der [bacterium]